MKYLVASLLVLFVHNNAYSNDIFERQRYLDKQQVIIDQKAAEKLSNANVIEHYSAIEVTEILKNSGYFKVFEDDPIVVNESGSDGGRLFLGIKKILNAGYSYEAAEYIVNYIENLFPEDQKKFYTIQPFCSSELCIISIRSSQSVDDFDHTFSFFCGEQDPWDRTCQFISPLYKSGYSYPPENINFTIMYKLPHLMGTSQPIAMDLSKLVYLSEEDSLKFWQAYIDSPKTKLKSILSETKEKIDDFFGADWFESPFEKPKLEFLECSKHRCNGYIANGKLIKVHDDKSYEYTSAVVLPNLCRAHESYLEFTEGKNYAIDLQFKCESIFYKSTLDQYEFIDIEGIEPRDFKLEKNKEKEYLARKNELMFTRDELEEFSRFLNTDNVEKRLPILNKQILGDSIEPIFPMNFSQEQAKTYTEIDWRHIIENITWGGQSFEYFKPYKTLEYVTLLNKIFENDYSPSATQHINNMFFDLFSGQTMDANIICSTESCIVTATEDYDVEKDSSKFFCEQYKAAFSGCRKFIPSRQKFDDFYRVSWILELTLANEYNDGSSYILKQKMLTKPNTNLQYKMWLHDLNRQINQNWGDDSAPKNMSLDFFSCEEISCYGVISNAVKSETHEGSDYIYDHDYIHAPGCTKYHENLHANPKKVGVFDLYVKCSKSLADHEYALIDKYPEPKPFNSTLSQMPMKAKIFLGKPFTQSDSMMETKINLEWSIPEHYFEKNPLKTASFVVRKLFFDQSFILNEDEEIFNILKQAGLEPLERFNRDGYSEKNTNVLEGIIGSQSIDYEDELLAHCSINFCLLTLKDSGKTNRTKFCEVLADKFDACNSLVMRRVNKKRIIIYELTLSNPVYDSKLTYGEIKTVDELRENYDQIETLYRDFVVNLIEKKKKGMNLLSMNCEDDHCNFTVTNAVKGKALPKGYEYKESIPFSLMCESEKILNPESHFIGYKDLEYHCPVFNIDWFGDNLFRSKMKI